MASVPIKFRCYRCSQLLGVARGKAGAVVACPKCSAELVVPEPSDAPPSPVLGGTAESRLGDLDAGVALDFLDIRPEDIRVEPGLAVAEVAERFPREPIAELDAVFEEESISVEIEGPPTAAQSSVAPPSKAAATLVQAPEGPPELPTIRLDGARRGAVGRKILEPSVRARDLVVPRSVVAAWSLLVLLAVAFAFLTGLLAGHFIWRVH